MSAFDEASSAGIPKEILALLQSYGGPAAWAWIDEHSDQTFIHLSGKVAGFIPYSITLKWGNPLLRIGLTQLLGSDTRGIQPGLPNS